MIFDSYERPLEIIKLGSKGLIFSPSSQNAQVVDGALHLQRQPSQEFYGDSTIISLGFRKPVPLPFEITNAPASSVNPDKSFSFTPDVRGGVQEYEFSIEDTPGDDFHFDPATGTLSRPPQ